MDGKECLKTLAAILERDHEPMNRMLEDAVHHSQRGAPELASAAFVSFQRFVTRHMKAEERVLSNLELEGRCPRQLVQRIIYGHLQLDLLIAKAAAALDHPAELGAAFDNLFRALIAHERVEEDEVLPMLCGALELDPSPFELRHAQN